MITVLVIIVVGMYPRRVFMSFLLPALQKKIKKNKIDVDCREQQQHTSSRGL